MELFKEQTANSHNSSRETVTGAGGSSVGDVVGSSPQDAGKISVDSFDINDKGNDVSNNTDSNNTVGGNINDAPIGSNDTNGVPVGSSCFHWLC